MHYYRGAAQFFTHYLLLVCTQLSLGSIFRLIAVASPDATMANAYAGITLLVLILTSGFSIIRREWMLFCVCCGDLQWARCCWCSPSCRSSVDAVHCGGPGHTTCSVSPHIFNWLSFNNFPCVSCISFCATCFPVASIPD